MSSPPYGKSLFLSQRVLFNNKRVDPDEASPVGVISLGSALFPVLPYYFELKPVHYLYNRTLNNETNKQRSIIYELTRIQQVYRSSSFLNGNRIIPNTQWGMSYRWELTPQAQQPQTGQGSNTIFDP